MAKTFQRKTFIEDGMAKSRIAQFPLAHLGRQEIQIVCPERSILIDPDLLPRDALIATLGALNGPRGRFVITVDFTPSESKETEHDFCEPVQGRST